MLPPILRNLICSRPRVTACLIFLAGVIGIFDLMHVYKTGGSMMQNDMYYTPVMTLIGFVCVLEPRVWLAYFADREHPSPARYKWMAYGTLAIGFLIALYLGGVVFRDWKEVPLSEMGNRH